MTSAELDHSKAGLVAAQVYLTRLTHRVFNLGLLGYFKCF